MNSTLNCSSPWNATKTLMNSNHSPNLTMQSISSSSWKWKYPSKKYNSIYSSMSGKMPISKSINSISNPSSYNISPNSSIDKWLSIGNIKQPIKSNNNPKFIKNMINMPHPSNTSKIGSRLFRSNSYFAKKILIYAGMKKMANYYKQSTSPFPWSYLIGRTRKEEWKN